MGAEQRIEEQPKVIDGFSASWSRCLARRAAVRVPPSAGRR